MLGQRSWDSWISEYGKSHGNPVNKALHLIGIPMIAASSVLLLPAALIAPVLLKWLLGCFLIGWVLQFIGHAFEGKPPEFFKDWRFLLVGFRWWLSKVFSKG